MLYITDIKTNGYNDVLFNDKIYLDACRGYFPNTSKTLDNGYVQVYDDSLKVSVIHVDDLDLDKYTPIEEIDIKVVLDHLK